MKVTFGLLFLLLFFSHPFMVWASIDKNCQIMARNNGYVSPNGNQYFFDKIFSDYQLLQSLGNNPGFARFTDM